MSTTGSLNSTAKIKKHPVSETLSVSTRSVFNANVDIECSCATLTRRVNDHDPTSKAARMIKII